MTLNVINVALIAAVSVQMAWIVILSVKQARTKKAMKSLAEENDEAHQKLQSNMVAIAKGLSKMQSSLDRQTDTLKRLELAVMQKLNPLLENNQVVSELRNRLRESESTVKSLQSTVLQMAQSVKRLQSRSKEEKTQGQTRRR